ncbi:hypothetical protein PEC18_21570 [Paucibacter sp. O1-1]|nr:hypothetical protein [Paucibacter sp. O1-1]MDA3828339.1 hypothetical protein [Paucibacter sp. O1-1]
MKVSLELLRNGFATGLAMLLGVGLLVCGYMLGISSMTIFCVLFAAVAMIAPPRNLVSPLSIIHGYYFVWFLLAPAFSELHSEDNFASGVHYVAYGMIFLTYVTAVFGARRGERAAAWTGQTMLPQAAVNPGHDTALRLVTIFLYIVSTALVVMIVLASGGFAYWIEAPGQAFLNREGSGVYVVLSHFAIFCLAALVGYHAYTARRIMPLIIFLAWLAITSPVHGSKGLISLFLILSLTPWLRDLEVHRFGIAHLRSDTDLHLLFRSVSPKHFVDHARRGRSLRA